MSNFKFTAIIAILSIGIFTVFACFTYSYLPKRYCTAYEESVTPRYSIKGISYGGYKVMKCVATTSEKKE